jgi:hypothetical protein
LINNGETVSSEKPVSDAPPPSRPSPDAPA